MIVKLLKVLWRIKNKERIPKLPRGMLATEYREITEDQRRIMARMGIRSPSGVNLALKRAKVKTTEELIALLKHHQPRRRMGEKLCLMIGRLFGSYGYDPHRSQLIKEAKRSPADIALKTRVKDISKRFYELD